MSLTLDDVFHNLENESWWLFYNDSETPPVVPLDIGENQIFKNKGNLHNLNIKQYIRKGEECPICFERLLYKKHSILTNCGHCFHTYCIAKYVNFNPHNMGWCPLCRQDMGSAFDKNKYINSPKLLDKLEDFWNNIDCLYPEHCDLDNITEHYLGMQKNCFYCIRYRKTGKNRYIK